jgi:hypothetical protein
MTTVDGLPDGAAVVYSRGLYVISGSRRARLTDFVGSAVRTIADGSPDVGWSAQRTLQNQGFETRNMCREFP